MISELDFEPAVGVLPNSDGNIWLYGDGIYLLDGNHEDYRTLISHTFFISGGWLPGEMLMLAWHGGEYGTLLAHGVAIDDLVVSFGTTPIPEPASFATLLAAGACGIAFTRRRRR